MKLLSTGAALLGAWACCASGCGPAPQPVRLVEITVVVTSEHPATCTLPNDPNGDFSKPTCQAAPRGDVLMQTCMIANIDDQTASLATQGSAADTVTYVRLTHTGEDTFFDSNFNQVTGGTREFPIEAGHAVSIVAAHDAGHVLYDISVDGALRVLDNQGALSDDGTVATFHYAAGEVDVTEVHTVASADVRQATVRQAAAGECSGKFEGGGGGGGCGDVGATPVSEPRTKGAPPPIEGMMLGTVALAWTAGRRRARRDAGETIHRRE